MIRLAKDYISGRIDLRALENWTNDHLGELAELPDDDPGGILWGFVQVRIWDMEPGSSEEELRRDLQQHLDQKSDARQSPQRAAG